MGRTESSAIRTGQNSPAAGSRSELPDFELEDLAAAYGARIPSSLFFESFDRDISWRDRAQVFAVAKN